LFVLLLECEIKVVNNVDRKIDSQVAIQNRTGRPTNLTISQNKN